MLVDKNILKNRNDKTYEVFTNNITNNFITDSTLPLNMSSSDYVKECWDRYRNFACSLSQNEQSKLNALNGKIFEVIVATAFYRAKVRPFYLQASSQLIPDVDYDIVMYDKAKNMPITISIKTSSRERYKQADLEAYAFTNVHRAALNYLVMLNEKDCMDVQKKIDSGMTLGLQRVIQANATEFDAFVDELRRKKLGSAPKVPLVEGQIVK